MFVERVAGPEICIGPQDGLVVRAKRGSETANKRANFLVASLIAGARTDARKAGNKLTECVSGNKAVEIIPAAHVVAGGGKAGALAIDLQQPIVIERKIVRVQRVILPLERAAGELDG